jgi:membrane fusion protein (multidrug efflux system)
MRALSLSLLALVACKKPEAAETKTVAVAAPVKVTTATATVAATPEVLVITGTIAPNYRSEVTADTQGKVVGIRVERGQRVKMGDPVVQLDVRSAALSQREANANLDTARAQKSLAEEECKRTQALLDKGAITKSEWDRQNTQCSTALQSVAAAQARAEMISKSVSDGVVRAPFAGIVTERSVSPGEWVAPGRALFTLVDDNPLRMELSVPEIAVRAVHKDQRVLLSAVSQPGKTYPATVTRIGAEIGKTRSLIVEATLDPQTDLVPGMFAEARLDIGKQDHPVVPKDAVVLRDKLYHAFVLVPAHGEGSGSKAMELEDHIVQIGDGPTPEQVAIVKGVDANAKVVRGITEQVVDGLRVTE